MPNPLSSSVSAGDTATAAQYNNLRNDAIKDFPYLYNRSAVTLVEGDVVIWDIANASSVTTTTLEGHRRIAGVIMTGAASGSQVWLAPYGCVATVKVTGTVAIGAALITSTTATRAKANGGATQPGLLGYALTSNPSGDGTVSAIICPTYDKFGSNVTIANQQTSSGTTGGGTDVVAITNMSCSGTNRLLVALLADSDSSGSFTNVKYGGTTMTLAQIGITSGTVKIAALAYMVNPPAGAANLTYSITTATCRTVGLCLDGVNQSTPVRTAATATGTSTTPAVTPGSGTAGDFALGVVSTGHATNPPSARGAGQVNLDTYQNINGATGFCDYEENIASTSEALTWTTPNSAAWAAVGILVNPL